MRFCYYDTETRGPENLRAVGGDKYLDRAECIMVQWAVGDDPVSIWEPLTDSNWLNFRIIPDELDALYRDPTVIFVAHNSGFDEGVTRRLLNRRVPIGRWHCTMAQAKAHGLHGSLEGVGKTLRLTDDQAKLSSGSALIQFFCVPKADGTFRDPKNFTVEWAEFCRYGKQDVAAMRYIHRKMPCHNYQGVNKETWMVNELANQRGFKFDVPLAEGCVRLLEIAKKRDNAAVDTATGGAVQAVTQRDKLLNYLRRKHPELENLRAATMREWLEHDDLSPEVRFLLTTRLEAAKSSGSKYKKGLTIKGLGDRLRGCLAFSGAGRTGRFSHKHFQPGNMSRRSKKYGKRWEELVANILNGCADLFYDDLNTICADVLRASITATDEDHELVVADWSNIESRVLAWIANEVWKLEAYRAIDRGEGVDLYKMLVHQFFGIPLDEVDDFLRQTGKVTELAFGFGGGVGAMVTMAAAYNLDLDVIAERVLPRAKPEHLKKAEKAYRRAIMKGDDYELEPRTYMALDVLKQVYRESNKGIDQFRYALDDAVKNAIRNTGEVYEVGRLKIWHTPSFLIIQLPSGRRLLYANAKIETRADIDPETLKERYSEVVTYITARGKGSIREQAWSGLFVENVVQAIANDVLRWAMVRIHKNTKHLTDAVTAIVLHVHDELALDLKKGALALKTLIAWMVQGEEWSGGLPLAAAGYVNFRYGAK